MAQYQKGQRDEALKTLAAAIISYDWSAAKADSHDPWFIHVLRPRGGVADSAEPAGILEGKYQPQDNDERLAF